jgi:hypothetical protein
MPPNREQRERLGYLLDVLDKLKNLRSDAEKFHAYRNVVGDARQDVLERWTDGNVACHLHVQLQASGPNLHTHNLCIAYQRPPRTIPEVRFDDLAPGVPEDRLGVGDEVVGKRERFDWQLVFVEIGEVPESGEGVDAPSTKVEPAAVRLMMVDDCPIFRGDLVQRGGLLEAPGAGIGRRGVS